MKVGTDGVLLGVWTNFHDRETVLDVGTGSGLIALMAAQRNPLAKITAIEIDEDAVGQAKENAKNSPFGNRISVLQTSFQDFASTAKERFDVIVSNPPFFAGSLPSPNAKRTDARHAQSLSARELLRLSKQMMTDRGRLSLIYPFGELENLQSIAEHEALYLLRETTVFPTTQGLPKRVLLDFGVSAPRDVIKNKLVIELKRHTYTPEFTELVKDFYMHL